MKKLLFLTIICSFYLANTIAQGAYSIYISWDASDPACDCPTGSTDSSYVINVYIRDIANEVSVVNKSKTVSITVSDAYVPVTEVEDYCDLPNPEETPVFYIQVTVSMLCVGSSPVIVCDGFKQVGPYGCDDFDEVIIVPTIDLLD